jgi:hypothetical protein
MPADVSVIFELREQMRWNEAEGASPPDLPHQFAWGDWLDPPLSQFLTCSASIGDELATPLFDGSLTQNLEERLLFRQRQGVRQLHKMFKTDCLRHRSS